MSTQRIVVGTTRSRELVSGVAATLRRLEREAAGVSPGTSTTAALRRLESFQRSLARSLQQAHLETVEELAST